jgi:hypothetical protein
MAAWQSVVVLKAAEVYVPEVACGPNWMAAPVPLIVSTWKTPSRIRI